MFFAITLLGCDGGLFGTGDGSDLGADLDTPDAISTEEMLPTDTDDAGGDMEASPGTDPVTDPGTVDVEDPENGISLQPQVRLTDQKPGSIWRHLTPNGLPRGCGTKRRNNVQTRPPVEFAPTGWQGAASAIAFAFLAKPGAG